MNRLKCYNCKRKYPFNRAMFVIKKVVAYPNSWTRRSVYYLWKCAICGQTKERIYGKLSKETILEKGKIEIDRKKPLPKLDYEFRCPLIKERE